MVFVACGLNHKTAPLHVREKFALSNDNNLGLLHRFTKSLNITEAAILSTCNRTEIYCDISDHSKIIPWISKEQNINLDSILPYFYTHQEENGIKHILRVASGLDSMMIGEPQILGQIKNAYHLAKDAGTIGDNLNPIFQYIFKTSKKIRTNSKIGENPTSIAFAATQLIANIFSEFSNLNVFLIGTGDTSSLVAKYLQELGVVNFMISNRTTQKAQYLAQKTHGQTIAITEIASNLAKADVIISATSCPIPFINKSMVENALIERSQKPMFFLDLAVPRDIEENVGDIKNVHLYNIDDLQTVTEKGLALRQKAALSAEKLITQEVDKYSIKCKTDLASDAIHIFEKNAKIISDIELNRAIKKITSGQCPYQILSEFNHRLTKKLTHIPKLGLRKIASHDSECLNELVNYFSKQD
jgi:glutamyl-tRNA reductase